MEINASAPFYTPGNTGQANGDRGTPTANKENQNSSKNVSNAESIDAVTDARLKRRYQTNSADRATRVIDHASVTTTSERSFEEISGDIELASMVIEQKKTPAVQAFLDIGDADSDFRLIDIYV